MRGLVAASLALALASLSGCVSLVEDNGDPDLDAAAAQAEQALSDYQAKNGHIAGTVLDAAGGVPLVTANVDLVGVATDLAVDSQGRFAFLDLAPGAYTLTVSAPDHLDQQFSVDVLAGQFTRPEVVLASTPPPEAYFTQTHFEGFTDINAFGFALSCYCDFDEDLDAEGLQEIVYEAQMDPSTATGDYFSWSLELEPVAEDGEWSYFSGYDSTPMRISILAEDLEEPAGHFYASLQPEGGLMVSMQQSFEGYVTAFYNAPAPEDFSAFAPVEE